MTIENPCDVLERSLRRTRDENERLKKQLDYLRSGKYLNQVKWERDFNEKMVEDLKNDLEAANSRTKELGERIIKALEYMKDFTFEPLLTNEDRKLIMYNANLRNFERILKGELNNE